MGKRDGAIMVQSMPYRVIIDKRNRIAKLIHLATGRKGYAPMLGPFRRTKKVLKSKSEAILYGAKLRARHRKWIRLDDEVPGKQNTD